MQTRTPFSSWYALAVLSMAVWYAVIDRQVLMLLAQPIKADLSLTDTQIGSLHGLGAALFTAIAVIPLGWLADRMDRRLLLAACVLVWSAAVAACGLATGYWSLLLCVAFLAAGEAGLSPIVFALIPELFPERQRMTANFTFFAAALIGGGAGIALAGAVISHIDWLAPWAPTALMAQESWRLAFFVVAVPGPFLALAIGLIRLKRRAPVHRGDGGPAATPPRSELREYLASHWKAVVGICTPAGVALLGTGPIFIWLPVILTRDFSLSAAEIGTGLGVAVGIGSIAGLTLVALVAKVLTATWGAAAPVRLLQVGYVMLAMLMPLYLVAHTPTQIYLIAGLQMTAVIGSSALTPTLVQDLAPAHLRGRIFALSTVITTLFQVVSPITVGFLSDHVFTRAGGLLLSCVALGVPSFLVAAITLRLTEKQVVATAMQVKAAAPPTDSPADPAAARGLNPSIPS